MIWLLLLLGLVPATIELTKLHGHDQVCATYGFCIAPPVVLYDIRSWLSWCWLQNGLVWIGLVITEFIFFIFNTTQWLIASLIGVQPAPIPSLAAFICLPVFLHGFLLIVLLMCITYDVVLPLAFRLIKYRVNTKRQ